MGSLHLVRHGQTTSNVMSRLDTRLPGAGLTDFGARQAVRFALERPHAAPAALFCSYARRARETAELIGSVWGVEAQPIEGIHEVQVGDLEDRNDKPSVDAFADLIKQWYAGKTDLSIGSSDTLETLFDRYLPVIERLRATHLTDPEAPDIYVVSHGAAIRLVAAHLANVDEAYALEHALPNTGSIELSHGSGSWDCVHWGGDVPTRPTEGTGTSDPMG